MALLFRYPHETRFDVNALMPIFHEGRIFISSGYGAGSELLKLTVAGKKASVEQAWQNKDLDNHHGGVVLLDGYLYGAAFKPGEHAWVCLDWNSGKTMYRAPGVGKGSLTSAEGMLYIYGDSDNGKVGLVRATPERARSDQPVSYSPGRRGSLLGPSGGLRRPALPPPRQFSLRLRREGAVVSR